MASPVKERLDASYVTDLQDLDVRLLLLPSDVCQATHVELF